MFTYMTPHQPTPQPKPLGVSVKDAVLITSISDKEIRDALTRGEFTARRRGTRILIDYDALMEWYYSHPLVVDPITKGA